MRQTLPWSDLLKHLTPEEAAFISNQAFAPPPIWAPLPGPQTIAYDSKADIIGFGGAAGGGKTDLSCGKALTQHQKILVLRREATQLTGIIDRFKELLKGTEGYNGQDKIYRLPSKQIEFGSTPNPDDWNKYQGRPHDLLVLDEAAHFLEIQVRALLGWVRSVDPRQKCQSLLTFNPPTNAEGRWIIEFFGPWLNPKHPRPANPGELRWFGVIQGRDMEVPDNRKFVLNKGERIYNFEPDKFDPTDIITPQSRTFIPSRVSDNPYLYGTGYMATLQALPEPLRSQMLKGDFQAGMQDDAMQVIPTAWVDAAMARWRKPNVLPEMTSMGIDVARGGTDNTIIARRHAGMWFDEPLTYAGTETPDGPKVAGLVLSASRDGAPQHIDVIGVGSSPYDFLNNARQPVVGVNVSETAYGTDKSGRLRFANQRSELWWKMREALDPTANNGIQLPPDNMLRADLCAPKWEARGPIIQVEGRKEIVKRIGRSPDWATAYVLALMETPKLKNIPGYRTYDDNYDPYGSMGEHDKTQRSYNPYEGL